MNLSLRMRLTIWYSAIVALTLSVFGFVSYFSVSTELKENLDASLSRVAWSLDYIIKKKQAETRQPLRPPQQRKKSSRQDDYEFLRSQQRYPFIGPVLPVEGEKEEEEPSVVWTAVYEHILLNSRNFLIQVADTNNAVVYRSENLRNNSLPVLSHITTVKTGEEKIYLPYEVDRNRLRLFLLRTKMGNISVGYPIEDVEMTLNNLFSTLLVAFPVVLLASIFGGWFLAKRSLEPVDEIARTAQEITGHNLSQRIPMPQTDDEIARLTATLNRMIERLEKSFNQIRQFTGDASHELRTPLAILMGELEIALHSRQTPEEYQKVLSSALEEVIRLSNVVSSLLELSRAETGQVRMNIENFNLSRMLEEICEDIDILAAEKNIALACSIEKSLMMDGDSARLHQAFLNIIENAVKYTLNGGEVFVGASRSGESILVLVRDTGIGIPEEDLPKIFDRFYRVDKSRTTQEIQGTGLGLSIVHWIIEAHQGTIGVESRVGEGTQFTITLPAGHQA